MIGVFEHTEVLMSGDVQELMSDASESKEELCDSDSLGLEILSLDQNADSDCHP